MSWDFLGGLFDLNRDGETDVIEQAIGLSVLEKLSEMEKEDDDK